MYSSPSHVAGSTAVKMTSSPHLSINRAEGPRRVTSTTQEVRNCRHSSPRRLLSFAVSVQAIGS